MDSYEACIERAQEAEQAARCEPLARQRAIQTESARRWNEMAERSLRVQTEATARHQATRQRLDDEKARLASLTGEA